VSAMGAPSWRAARRRARSATAPSACPAWRPARRHRRMVNEHPNIPAICSHAGACTHAAGPSQSCSKGSKWAGGVPDQATRAGRGGSWGAQSGGRRAG
jgi:hypothetical protein